MLPRNVPSTKLKGILIPVCGSIQHNLGTLNFIHPVNVPLVTAFLVDVLPLKIMPF